MVSCRAGVLARREEIRCYAVGVRRSGGGVVAVEQTLQDGERPHSAEVLIVEPVSDRCVGRPECWSEHELES